MGVENKAVKVEQSKKKLRKIHNGWLGWKWVWLTDREYEILNHHSGDIAYDVESSMKRNSRGEGEAAKINRRWLGNRD